MKAADIKKKSEKDLHKEVRNLRETIHKERMSTGRGSVKVRDARRMIARIMTELTARAKVEQF